MANSSQQYDPVNPFDQIGLGFKLLFLILKIALMVWVYKGVKKIAFNTYYYTLGKARAWGVFVAASFVVSFFSYVCIDKSEDAFAKGIFVALVSLAGAFVLFLLLGLIGRNKRMAVREYVEHEIYKADLQMTDFSYDVQQVVDSGSTELLLVALKRELDRIDPNGTGSIAARFCANKDEFMRRNGVELTNAVLEMLCQ